MLKREKSPVPISIKIKKIEDLLRRARRLKKAMAQEQKMEKKTLDSSVSTSSY